MNSIVIDLQEQALSDSTSLSALLRLTLAVAKKLNIQDMEVWTKNELNGYDKHIPVDQIPEYRKYRGSLHGFNPHLGWKPIAIECRDTEDLILNMSNYQSIAEIEQLQGRTELLWPLTGAQELDIQKMIKAGVTIKRVIPSLAINKICSGFRNIILEWALALEKEGILGSNMSFTNKEKENAKSATTINIDKIEHFTGNLGDMRHSQITQDFSIKIEKNDFDTLSQYLLSNNISKDDIILLEVAIKSDPSPTVPRQFGGKVGAWIGSMTSKAVAGTLAISVDVVAGVLTDAISKYYGF